LPKDLSDLISFSQKPCK